MTQPRSGTGCSAPRVSCRRTSPAAASFPDELATCTWVRDYRGRHDLPARSRHPAPCDKTAKRLGFTLTEIADLLEVATHRHGRPQRPSGLQARAAAKLAEVEQRIADLDVIRTTLQQALRAGCDDLLECADSPCCPIPFAALAIDADAQRAGASLV